jgi:hypothetical protein
MGTFVQIKHDGYSPEFGEINWKRRLNQRLEDQDATLEPVGYKEEGKPTMQITQENCVIYINQIADELDVVAVMYDQDPDDIWTWYFREKFQNDEMFAHVVSVVGTWATQIVTLYPMEHVVKQYEQFQEDQIPDSLPEDFV